MKSILDLTKKLIAIPSVTYEQQPTNTIVYVVKQELQDFTIEEFFHDNCPSLLIYAGSEKVRNFTIMLNAHLDVVPSTDHYNSHSSKDKLYGRGAYDMKAAAATMIHIFRELAPTLPYPLGLQLVTDEEQSPFGGTAYQIQKGVSSDFFLIGEPTDFAIAHKLKGRYAIEITFTGKSAHGAYPWNGDNAAWQAQHFLEKLRHIYTIPTKEVWHTTATIASIHTSNKTSNIVADDCILTLDIRYIPEDDKTLRQTIKKLLPQSANIKVIVDAKAHDTPGTNSFIRHLEKSTENVLGKPSPLVARHGTGDLRHCPQGIEFGPIGANAHGENEWVSIKSIDKYYQILKDFLLSIR